MRALRNLIRALVAGLTVAFGVSMLPFGFAGFAVWRVMLARRPQAERIVRTQRVFHRAFLFMHQVLAFNRILDYDLGDVAESMIEGPCVIVANHPTFPDTSAICATTPQVTTIVKSAMYRRWYLRGLFDQAGYIEDARGEFLGAERLLESIVEHLERGERVLIFPEGSRTVGPTMGRFGRVAFEAACRADVPVLPIAIRCEPLWLAKGWRPWRPPAEGRPRLSIRALPPAHPADHEGSSRRLRDAIYDRLTSAFQAESHQR